MSARLQPPSKKLKQSTLSFAAHAKKKCDGKSDSVCKAFSEYDVTDVPRDGDCMFSCLAMGLQRESAMDIRLEIVSYLKEHPKMVENFLWTEDRKCLSRNDAMSSLLYDTSLEAYLHKMSMRGEWGDGIMLVCASALYAIQIDIVLEDASVIKFTPQDQEAKPKQVDMRTVVLGFVKSPGASEANHYVYLQRKDGDAIPSFRDDYLRSESSKTTNERGDDEQVEMKKGHVGASTESVASSDNDKSCVQQDTVTVSDKPFQPSDVAVYPVQNTRLLCKNGTPKMRYMNLSWYKQYPWLHFDVDTRKLFCFVCLRAKSRTVLLTHRVQYEPAFIESGFSDWKNAARAFERHSKCDCHREAVAVAESALKPSVRAHRSSHIACNQQCASKALYAILTSVQYLARQGLALCGHSETSGNLYQLLLVRFCDVPEIATFLQRRISFLSHDIQNEILQLMAHDVLQSIVKDITQSKLKYFSVIVDETTDASTHEQVSICLRGLTDVSEPFEHFVGLYQTASTTGETLSDIITDVLTRFALPLSMLRGQCYDSASNMSGTVKGVRARIQQLQPKAIYIHCFAHSLNLSVQDAVRTIPFVRDVMQCLRDLATIARGSAKRADTFKAVADGIEFGNPILPRPLCLTRWTVRFAALDAAIRSYAVILPFLGEVMTMATADESASKARGLLSQFENGQFFLALLAAHRVFGVTDSLACSLQSSTVTVYGSMEAVNHAVSQLRSMRNDESFETLWSDAHNGIEEYALSEVTLPRNVRPPKRYEQQVRTAAAHVFMTAKDYFRVQYFTFLDGVLQHITDRFDQPGMETYREMESMLLSAYHGDVDDDRVEAICTLYDELDYGRLCVQLRMLPTLAADTPQASVNVARCFDLFRSKSPEVQSLFRKLKDCSSCS